MSQSLFGETTLWAAEDTGSPASSGGAGCGRDCRDTLDLVKHLETKEQKEERKKLPKEEQDEKLYCKTPERALQLVVEDLNRTHTVAGCRVKSVWTSLEASTMGTVVLLCVVKNAPLAEAADVFAFTAVVARDEQGTWTESPLVNQNAHLRLSVQCKHMASTTLSAAAIEAEFDKMTTENSFVVVAHNSHNVPEVPAAYRDRTLCVLMSNAKLWFAPVPVAFSREPSPWIGSSHVQRKHLREEL